MLIQINDHTHSAWNSHWSHTSCPGHKMSSPRAPQTSHAFGCDQSCSLSGPCVLSAAAFRVQTQCEAPGGLGLTDLSLLMWPEAHLLGDASLALRRRNIRGSQSGKAPTIPLKIGKAGSPVLEVIRPQSDRWLVLAHSTLPTPSVPMPGTPRRCFIEPWTPLPLFTH